MVKAPNSLRPARPLRSRPRHGTGRKMETSSSSSIMSTSWSWKEEGDELVLFDHIHVMELEGRWRPARLPLSRPPRGAERKMETSSSSSIMSMSGNWKEEGDQLVLFHHVHVLKLEGKGTLEHKKCWFPTDRQRLHYPTIFNWSNQLLLLNHRHVLGLKGPKDSQLLKYWWGKLGIDDELSRVDVLIGAD